VTGHLLVGGLLVAAGGLQFGLARRITAGRLPRNRWAGLRTRSTLAGPEAWRAGQAATVPSLRVGAACYAAGGLALLGTGLLGGPSAALPVVAGAVAVVTVVLAVAQVRAGDRAARRT
jgi:hypothetical protein